MIILKVFLLLGAFCQTKAIFDDEVYSVFYDVNTIPKTVHLNKKSFIYVGSARIEDNKEKNIRLTSPENDVISIYNATRNVTDGLLAPAFPYPVDEFTVTAAFNTVPYEFPAIIYAVEEGADNRVVTSLEGEKTRIDLNGTSIHNIFVTVLCPKKFTTIYNISGTSMMSWLSLSAGGAKEARMEEYKLLDLGKMVGRNNPGLLLLEEIITFRQTASFPGSISMNVQSDDYYHNGSDVIEMSVDWGDTVLAMSSGYKFLREQTDQTYFDVKYNFKAKHNNTKYDIQFTGSIYDDAAITLRNRGYDGVQIHGFSEKLNLVQEAYELKGAELQLSFNLMKEKVVDGRKSQFLAVINIDKATSSTFFMLLPLLAIFFTY